MTRTPLLFALLIALPTPAFAGQAPRRASDPDTSVSARDRVYAAEQFSNTVSVVRPSDGKLLGVIRLGDPTPGNLSPLYRGQLLVHGLGFSPDHRTLVVVAIGSNSVTFIDTATNAVKHTTYVGRSPHEAFFTPDGHEVWVTIRGESYVSVLDPVSFRETARIRTAAGPGMTSFSPDGRYGYICSSFEPETQIIEVASHRSVGKLAQLSAFCPNLAATPDGKQVWLTLKDVGKVMVFDARPPFSMLHTLATGPITNHVNFARTARGQLAYVTVGGSNEVQVFDTANFTKVATIAAGQLPHGLWPSGDGTRMYVGLENSDALAVIDTSAQQVIAQIPVGQAPQAVVYVPDAVPSGDGTQQLSALAPEGTVATLQLSAAGSDAPPVTSVALFDQGLVQQLQAAVTGLEPKQPYTLALASRADGSGELQALAAFNTNPAGAAIVNTIGPIRQLVQDGAAAERRFLVIAKGGASAGGAVVQVQVP